MNKELIHSIVMPNYPRKVLLSKQRRAKYFVQGKDDAVKDKKKYASMRYMWKEHIAASKKKEIRLFDTATNEFVIKNSRIAGTERWLTINGQHYYDGKYPDYIKGKILNELAAFYTSFLQALTPIDQYPLYIEYIFYCKLDDSTDLDNHAFPYYKGFQDCLTKNKIIKNDTWKHINGFTVGHFDSEENKLIVNIYKV